MAFESVFLTMGAVMGGVFTIVGWVLWKMVLTPMSWPVEVAVAMQRGDGIVWDMNERGKFVKNKKTGIEIFRLKKRKKNLKPPKLSSIELSKKGKPVYRIIQTTRGQFFPIASVFSKNKIKPFIDEKIVEDASAKNWGMLELKRLEQKYSQPMSLFMQYVPYIMSATFAAMVIFFVIYFGGKVEVSSNQLAGASQVLAEAMTKLSQWTPAPSLPPVTTTTIIGG